MLNLSLIFVLLPIHTNLSSCHFKKFKNTTKSTLISNISIEDRIGAYASAPLRDAFTRCFMGSILTPSLNTECFEKDGKQRNILTLGCSCSALCLQWG